MEDNTFIKIIIVLLIILAVVITAGTIYLFVNPININEITAETESEQTTQNNNSKSYENKPSIPNKTFFGIYGVDKKEALADVIMVGCFNRNTKKVNVISVPRDTFVVMSPEDIAQLKKEGLWAPADGMKINAVHSYAGKKGNEYLTKQLNDLLGIDIDYYFEVNIDAFIKIVDAIGGVEINVPRRFYYSDPTQNLLINLKPGLQRLNGEQAQGFVRFRQYVQGDITRIEMQKMFIKELCKQALNKDAILSNASEFISIFFENVKTNMKITDALKYADALSDFSAYDLTMETLPGNGQTPYIIYEDEANEMVDRLFYDIYKTETTETTSNVKSNF